MSNEIEKTEENNNKNNKNNISIITGDPKRAIRKLSWPIMVSMLVTFAYNLADTIWVAGLGTESLAALGFFMPIFLIIIGLGNGIGAGANSLIARSIGAKDKKKADNTAIHGLLITLIISIIAPIILIFFLNDILLLMGAASVANLTAEYARVILAGLIVLLFSSVGASILRSEGDVNRAMKVMILTAVLNIIIDPIFIYILNLGLAGAAYATLLSSFISSFVIFYWLIIKRDTYLNLSKERFNFDMGIIKEIVFIAIPATSEIIIFSIVSLVINFMLSFIAGPLGVAVYTAGWRIVNLAMIPHMGLGTATLTVVGAAYGARKFKKLITTYNYSVKFGLSISIISSIIIFVFAPQIAMIFSYSETNLIPAISDFLRILSIFCIALPLGILSSSTFQGLGKAFISLTLTIQRALVFEIIFMYIFAFVLNMGTAGIWWGLSLGGLVGYLVSYIYTKIYLREIKKVYID
ncbi:putative transporter protein [Methanobrevibacter arboriphilus JCM 13429 = DSM 1125]|uniref:Putative transporter protein n=1 Tax=Methanobrevibacter arboriphilus JCM 13429 = DSM 1125 TaxID=1300164 RepID=A0A1V6N1U9_METAZ|nr:MATE family efflux transporter [Methanobrevibacter arboriphilus]OQD58587.1 putative transporter protein [Methanobrevibacter arboriphilus JCM 13429 = DSM 1125]